MTFEISGTIVRLAVLAILAATLLLIFIVRRFFQHESTLDLTAKNKGRKWRSPLEGKNKYPEVDAFALRNTFLEYGLLVALFLMILAFSWTTYEKQIDISQYLGTLGDEIEMETPRTAEPPPPPPPPPQPTAVQIVASDLPEVETMTFQDQSIDAQAEVVAVPPAVVETKKEVAPPPPPPPAIDEEREIFKIVEQNPMFPGCEEIADKAERQKCAEEKMLQFIYSNIQYPSIARENGVAGMVVVQFVVERDGSISNITLVRDIGAGCGDEAMRIVKSMPKWNPGKQRERSVRVQFTLPVRFKLE
jgi:protein TonB